MALTLRRTVETVSQPVFNQKKRSISERFCYVFDIFQFGFLI